MRQATTWMLAGFLALALSATAQGQLGPDRTFQEYKLKAELVPTAVGEQLDAWGIAEKAVKNGVEVFAVRVVADAPDGTLFEVTIETAEGRFDVGAVRTVLGSGLLVLRSSIDPSEAFPVARIQGVLVTFRGETILQGRFPQP